MRRAPYVGFLLRKQRSARVSFSEPQASPRSPHGPLRNKPILQPRGIQCSCIVRTSLDVCVIYVLLHDATHLDSGRFNSLHYGDPSPDFYFVRTSFHPPDLALTPSYSLHHVAAIPFLRSLLDAVPQHTSQLHENRQATPTALRTTVHQFPRFVPQ